MNNFHVFVRDLENQIAMDLFNKIDELEDHFIFFYLDLEKNKMESPVRSITFDISRVFYLTVSYLSNYEYLYMSHFTNIKKMI